jgi:enolase-phosphatase E1
MSASLHPFSVVLLDIEGTTTPVDFVFEVLFPYARVRVRDFLKEHPADAREEIAGLREENRKDRERGLNPPAIADSSESEFVDSLTVYAQWLIDADRKSTPLKSLQGKIWEEGYSAGRLLAQVFEDVPRAFRKWRDEQKAICIYSSGSALAQRLLFAHTEAGDLTPMIDRYFDTTIGAKTEKESYGRIASALERDPSEIVFISDVTTELDAARAAGLQTLLSIRRGNRPQQNASSYIAIRSFDEIAG